MSFDSFDMALLKEELENIGRPFLKRSREPISDDSDNETKRPKALASAIVSIAMGKLKLPEREEDDLTLSTMYKAICTYDGQLLANHTSV